MPKYLTLKLSESSMKDQVELCVYNSITTDDVSHEVNIIINTVVNKYNKLHNISVIDGI